MTVKEQLYYLIEKYHEDKYDTPTFASQFDIIYCNDVDYNELNKEEKTLFSELSFIAGRYSQFEEDFVDSPSFFYNDDDVKKKAEEVYQKTRKFR